MGWWWWGALKPEIDDGLRSPCTSAHAQILPITSVLVHFCVRGASDMCIFACAILWRVLARAPVPPF